MTSAEAPSRSKIGVAALFFIAAAFIAIADLWSKEAVFDLLNVETQTAPDGKPFVNSQERKVVFESWFWLEANYNHGAFSGWFSNQTSGLAVVSGIALIVILAIFVVHLRSSHPERVFSLALGCVLGGTLGNLYDRALLAGVRDWIRWFVTIGDEEWVWPNFNIADAGICTGVVLLIIREFFLVKRETPEETPEAERSADPA